MKQKNSKIYKLIYYYLHLLMTNQLTLKIGNKTVQYMNDSKVHTIDNKQYIKHDLIIDNKEHTFSIEHLCDTRWSIQKIKDEIRKIHSDDFVNSLSKHYVEDTIQSVHKEEVEMACEQIQNILRDHFSVDNSKVILESFKKIIVGVITKN